GLVIGLIAGSLGSYLLLRKYYLPTHHALTRQQVNEEYVVRDMYDNLLYNLQEKEKELESKRNDILRFSNQVSALLKEKEQMADFGRELARIHEANREQFRNLATDILKEKSRDLADNNKTTLDHILAPLKNDIGQFKKTIEDTRKEDIQDITSLKKEIESLHRLNMQLSEDAQKLAGALK